jgi:hypothetical protein
VDACLGDVVPYLLEIDLGIEGPSRIGNGALGESAKASITGLLLPVTVDKNDIIIVLLTERLGNIFVEEYVAIGNDRTACRTL